MTQKDQEKWDSKYDTAEFIAGKLPCKWLTENSELLSGRGRALDLAMGEGRNAVYLAALGYEVQGVDISTVGTDKAKILAKQKTSIYRLRFPIWIITNQKAMNTI